MSHVAWSVYVCLRLSVCWSHGCAVQKTVEPIEYTRTWGLTFVGSSNHYVRWGRDPPLGQFWGSGKLKSFGSLCCGVDSKKDNSIINNGMTARLLQPTAMLPTGWCDITLYSMKNLPSAMRPFVKIIWPLVIVIPCILIPSSTQQDLYCDKCKKLQFIHNVNGDGSKTAKIIKRLNTTFFDFSRWRPSAI